MRVHGKRYYYQVLLGQGRGALLNELAGDRRPTHYIRDLLYDHIERQFPKEVYEEALQRDEDIDHASKVNRIGSRILNALQQAND